MLTTLFIIVITVIVIAFDLYVYVHVEHETISEAMAKVAKRHPVIVLLWGVLMGHWFWGMCV